MTAAPAKLDPTGTWLRRDANELEADRRSRRPHEPPTPPVLVAEANQTGETHG
jgi:hypothetical protein